jgi:hypothetical protein
MGYFYNFVNVFQVLNFVRFFVQCCQVDPNLVVLQRYKETWTELKTEHKNSDEEFHYYESESPGLSLFVISMKQQITEEEPVQKDLPEPELRLLQEESPGLNDTKKAIEQSVSNRGYKKPKDKNSLIFIGIIIILVITVYMILLKKLPSKKKQK